MSLELEYYCFFNLVVVGTQEVDGSVNFGQSDGSVYLFKPDIYKGEPVSRMGQPGKVCYELEVLPT